MLNPLYLKEDSIQQLQKTWKEKRSIMLTSIFMPERYKELQEKVEIPTYTREIKPDKYSSAKTQQSIHNKELFLLLSKITGKKVTQLRGEVYRLVWKDYTLLHDRRREKAGIDIIIDLSDDWDEAWGGAIIYTNGKGGASKILGKGNSITIIERKGPLRRFLQYVNNKSRGKKRYIFLATV